MAYQQNGKSIVSLESWQITATKGPSTASKSGGSGRRRRTSLPAGGGIHVNKTIEKRRLADLKPHPKQAGLFEELPEEQIKALAEASKLTAWITRSDPSRRRSSAGTSAKALSCLAGRSALLGPLRPADDKAVEARLINITCITATRPAIRGPVLQRLKEMGWCRWTSEAETRRPAGCGRPYGRHVGQIWIVCSDPGRSCGAACHESGLTCGCHGRANVEGGSGKNRPQD